MSGLGLVYMEQRYYDPAIGRFISPDPIGYAGGLNLYGYALNDPVNRVDPSGLIPLDEIWDVGAVAVDIGFIVWDEFTGAPAPIKGLNRGALALDLGALAIPYFPAIGRGVVAAGREAALASHATAAVRAARAGTVAAQATRAGVLMAARSAGSGANCEPSGASGRGSARKPWQLTDEMSDAKRIINGRTYFRQKGTGLWWSRDTAGHGGSVFKVFKEGPGGVLKWFRDADEFGDFIDAAAKHKGPIGTVLR